MRILWNPTQLTCNLTIGNWPACEGIQKITGFSRGWHHWNSIRLGYNRSDGAKFVRLFMYAYVSGKQVSILIGEFNVGAKVKVNLEMTNTDYYVSVVVPGMAVRCKQIKFDNHRFTLPIGYQLFPYAEIDGTEKRTPFNPDIRDLVVR